MKALIAADVFAALPTVIWMLVFRGMSAHYASMPAYGYSGAWDFWVYFPLGMVLGLLAAFVTFNFIKRSPGALAWIGGAAMLPVLPFGMMVGGGV